MTVNTFLEKLANTPEKIEFTELLELIDKHYNFSETAFKNGDLYNQAGQNSGSCKLFAFARIHQLNEAQTLACFGQYYRDVLLNPTGEDHQNIRNFMKTGWAGIVFEGEALIAKE